MAKKQSPEAKEFHEICRWHERLFVAPTSLETLKTELPLFESYRDMDCLSDYCSAIRSLKLLADTLDNIYSANGYFCGFDRTPCEKVVLICRAIIRTH